MANRERTRKVTKPVVIENDMVPIEKLINYAKNSRTHSKKQLEQLAASIAEFGFVNPVLVWKKNEIIAGHGRVAAARTLIESDPERFAHLKLIPVRRCDHLTDTQRRALVIADNKLALNADWDDNVLAEELRALNESIDLGITGFDPKELTVMLGSVTEPELEEEEEGEQDDGPGNSIVQYNIIFDDVSQQKLWHKFLKHVTKLYPDEETIAGKITAYLQSEVEME